MPQQHIFLIGFMGAGKSTVAKRLAARTGLSCVETDARIVEDEGMAITEIFERYGEAHFRDLEHRMLTRLAKREGCIVSCGGGIVIREDNVAAMKQAGQIVLLQATAQTIYERVRDSADRPLLNGHMNVDYIAAMMAKRAARYEAVADLAVATDGKTVDAICEEIMAVLGEEPS